MLPQIAFDALKIACKCLRVLGTDFQAPPAVDTVIYHDTCLLILDGYGFDRAVAHTFVTVTALCVLKVNDFHLTKPPVVYFYAHYVYKIYFTREAGEYPDYVFVVK